jgi:hypothetical protein
MKILTKGASLLILLFFTNFAFSGEITEDSLNKLMALSGLDKQISELPGIIQAELEQAKQQGTPIPDTEFNEVKSSIVRAFEPSVILSTIGLEIKKNIPEQEAKDLLAWYESDLGRQITKAEEDASTHVAYQEMIKNAQALLADEKRVESAKKIDRLIDATGMAMQLQENAGLAVFTAISTAMNPGQSVNTEDFKALMSAQEQQVRANVEQFVLLSFVYSYRDIDMASLDKYISFLERPNTKKFNDSVIKGLTHALNKSIDGMAKSLAVVFKNNENKANEQLH